MTVKLKIVTSNYNFTCLNRIASISSSPKFGPEATELTSPIFSGAKVGQTCIKTLSF